MILVHEQDVTEWYIFSCKVQMVQAKENLYSVYMFTASFLHKM